MFRFIFIAIVIAVPLDAVQAAFSRPVLDDRAMTPVIGSLERIREIVRLLVRQIDVLETMTPLSFLSFRSLLRFFIRSLLRSLLRPLFTTL